MKRREFLRTAGAAAVLPVLPLPALASPMATAPASASAVNAMQVGWAALYARANHRATPALLQKWLRINPSQANAMMSELVKRGVVHTPIAGSAAAVQPMYSAQNVGGLFGSKRKAAQTAKDVFDALVQDDDETEDAGAELCDEHDVVVADEGPNEGDPHETA